MNPDGSLSGSVKAMLGTIVRSTLPPDRIATETNIPLFRVRSGHREMESAGLVETAADGTYAITASGREKL